MIKKKLIILRGLPGSGKSTWVDELIKVKCVVCSADNFFCNESGTYKFDPSKIAQAHEKCKIKAFNAMAKGEQLIIIDNTNIQHWEYELYTFFAHHFDYEVSIKTIGSTSNVEKIKEYVKRNIHGVDIERILAMAVRWED
jgi:predicted kinase